MADWNTDLWSFHIVRGTRGDEDEEIHELDEEPERYERGGHVEWYGVAAGEDFFIEYDSDEVMFSYVHAPLTEEEKEHDGLVVRYTHFYDQ